MNVSSRLPTGAFALIITLATAHVQAELADLKVRTTPVVQAFRPASTHVAQAFRPASPTRFAAPKANGFELTVDSIMRGPKLVGYPPTGLRWSGDSARVYFEWRQPAEDEASTWVVAREGGEPRKLTDAERRRAPSPNGVWD